MELRTSDETVREYPALLHHQSRTSQRCSIQAKRRQQRSVIHNLEIVDDKGLRSEWAPRSFDFVVRHELVRVLCLVLTHRGNSECVAA